MTDGFVKRPDSQPPEQQSHQPGFEHEMKQKPRFVHPGKGADKLKGKVAIITGGDSGIGRAVAVAFAKEGANVAISYLKEHKDADETRQLVKKNGSEGILISGDVADEKICQEVVEKTLESFGRLDILVNNAAEQHPQNSLEDISKEQLERTFATNIFSMFHMSKAALPHLKQGGVIINTSSVTAYKGNPKLLDYSSTKGAITSFTRSLALSLAEKGIRVNSVAPGPIWTPLIPSTFPPDHVKNFGKDTALGRAGQPEEVAMAYVYLASDDSSYVTGQTIHVNGGNMVTS